jgi:hypothetical protein
LLLPPSQLASRSNSHWRPVKSRELRDEDRAAALAGDLDRLEDFANALAQPILGHRPRRQVDPLDDVDQERRLARHHHHRDDRLASLMGEDHLVEADAGAIVDIVRVARQSRRMGRDQHQDDVGFDDPAPDLLGKLLLGPGRLTDPLAVDPDVVAGGAQQHRQPLGDLGRVPPAIALEDQGFWFGRRVGCHRLFLREVQGHCYWIARSRRGGDATLAIRVRFRRAISKRRKRRNNMADGKSTGGVIAVVIVIIVIVAVAFGFLRVRQTKDAKLPEVSVSGGQAPKFDVDAAKVAVGTTQTSVTVPKVETKQESITLPTVSVDKPGK